MCRRHHVVDAGGRRRLVVAVGIDGAAVALRHRPGHCRVRRARHGGAERERAVGRTLRAIRRDQDAHLGRRRIDHHGRGRGLRRIRVRRGDDLIGAAGRRRGVQALRVDAATRAALGHRPRHRCVGGVLHRGHEARRRAVRELELVGRDRDRDGQRRRGDRHLGGRRLRRVGVARRSDVVRAGRIRSCVDAVAVDGAAGASFGDGPGDRGVGGPGHYSRETLRAIHFQRGLTSQDVDDDLRRQRRHRHHRRRESLAIGAARGDDVKRSTVRRGHIESHGIDRPSSALGDRPVDRPVGCIADVGAELLGLQRQQRDGSRPDRYRDFARGRPSRWRQARVGLRIAAATDRESARERRAPREPKTHVPLRRRKGGNGTAGSAVPAQAALFDRGPRRKEAHGALSQRGDGQRGIDPRIHGDATKAQVRSLAGALSHFFAGLPVFFLAQSGLFRLVTFPFSPPN